jgi:cholera toxin transcriptional activator
VSEGGERGRIFRFGAFELDTATGDLRKDGAARPRVRDQALAILTMLLERRGELVTREELQERVWAADTFVDFEHGLNSAVNQVRGALGDAAGNPRFVQTVPRRGYRFIAPVVMVEPGAIGVAGPVAALAGGEVAGDGAGFGGVAAVADVAGVAGVSAAEKTASSILSARGDLPVMGKRRARFLFFLIQTMYLGFYLVGLARVSVIGLILEPLERHSVWLLVVLMVTAAVGIPVRLYLMTAAGLNYAGLGGKFTRLFPFVLVLDVIWAGSPFLLMPWIGMGLALASTAVLLYVPFAQRSLLLMGESQGENAD